MQVFVGHTGGVNCGEFTPDGEINLLRMRRNITDRVVRQTHYHRLCGRIADILGSSIAYADF